jgi:hypothetical protein
VVVADYFGIAFLASLHGVAADLEDAAVQALSAGVDVELPTGNAYRGPLAAAVRAGIVPETLVDRAVTRVLRQKEALGLLDETFAGDGVEPGSLDPVEHRALAARLAEEGVVLLANDGTLPLAAPGRVAVIGPNAHRATALFGCYSFANHVLDQHPEVPLGIEVPTVLEALHAELGDAQVDYALGCGVDDPDRSGFAAAADAARGADVALIVVGDRAGLFGRGTSGEGCDADSLELPGVQRDLVEHVLATGTPVVLVAVTGRPYALDWALNSCAAVVQTFFPGEEGAAAVAGVLSGRVNPSGRLPVSMPRSAGSQPYSYLHPPLGGPSSVSNLDNEPARPFGYGLSYTTFTHDDLRVQADAVPTDGTIDVTVRVTNTGTRAGVDVVQLYAHDPVAAISRPVAQLLGYARVELEAGHEATLGFAVPTTRLAFSGRDLVRAVEPGLVELWVGASCTERETQAQVELVGARHRVTVEDPRWVNVDIRTAVAAPGEG